MKQCIKACLIGAVTAVSPLAEAGGFETIRVQYGGPGAFEPMKDYGQYLDSQSAADLTIRFKDPEFIGAVDAFNAFDAFDAFDVVDGVYIGGVRESWRGHWPWPWCRWLCPPPPPCPWIWCGGAAGEAEPAEDTKRLAGSVEAGRATGDWSRAGAAPGPVRASDAVRIAASGIDWAQARDCVRTCTDDCDKLAGEGGGEAGTRAAPDGDGTTSGLGLCYAGCHDRCAPDKEDN